MKHLLKFLEYNLILILLIVFAFNIYSFVSIKVLKKDLASVNGYALLEVVSGSMEETIKIGDLIIIDLNYEDYKVDDIATFRDENGTFVTHRIIEVNENGYVTKGDNNDSNDQGIRVKEEMVGKYVFRLPMMGLILSSLKNPISLVMILLVGIVVCILMSTDSNLKPLDVGVDDEEFLEFLKSEKVTTKNKRKTSKRDSEKIKQKIESPKKEIKKTEVKKTTKTTSNKKSSK